MSKPSNTIDMTEKERVLCADVIQSLKGKFISGDGLR